MNIKYFKIFENDKMIGTYPTIKACDEELEKIYNSDKVYTYTLCEYDLTSETYKTIESIKVELEK